MQILKRAHLTLLWRRPLSYRNQSIDLRSKSMDRFLLDRDLRHEWVKDALNHREVLRTLTNMHDEIFFKKIDKKFTNEKFVTLSWRTSLSYRNQSIDFQTKSMDWFIHDKDFRYERVKCQNHLKLMYKCGN